MGTPAPALGGYYLSRTNDYVKYLINQYEVKSLTSLAQLYNRNTVFPLLSAIMSGNRFKWILRHLCFDRAISSHGRKA